MELKTSFLGHYDLNTWLSTIFYTAFILLVFKFSKAPKFKNGFTWKFFFNDNAYDLILNACITVLILRTGDGLIHFLYETVNNKLLSKFEIVLNPDGMDVVMAISFMTTIISYVIHKYWRKPISKKVAEKMHIHNENCKH